MDAIDVEIINILQENARTPVSDISKKVNLSPPAVADRIKKMVDGGVIKQFTTILDPKLTGNELEAILFVTLRGTKPATKFLELLEKEKEILSCFYVAGDYDFMIRVSTKNTATLEQLLTKLRNLHEFARTRTIVMLKTFKERYSISP